MLIPIIVLLYVAIIISPYTTYHVIHTDFRKYALNVCTIVDDF